MCRVVGVRRESRWVGEVMGVRATIVGYWRERFLGSFRGSIDGYEVKGGEGHEIREGLFSGRRWRRLTKLLYPTRQWRQ